ncbi:MAG: EVE domain-containing protein [Gemmatimonadota bacterium]|jgi:hypothetical protein|nr:EVE domain-containing protein [Gemmatimonadota bacterium]
MIRCWVGVVSLQHVMLGVARGFAQVCHGKQAPLRRMAPGDWLVYYSPRDRMDGGSALQAFTAAGRIRPSTVYQVQCDGFSPYRRDVDFVDCRPAPIRPLLSQLSFTQGLPNWGYRFRLGHFEIDRRDFRLIAQAMGIVRLPASNDG